MVVLSKRKKTTAPALTQLQPHASSDANPRQQQQRQQREPVWGPSGRAARCRAEEEQGAAALAPISLRDLPEHVLSVVFSFLDTRSKCFAARVCRTWYAAAQAPCVWRNAVAVVRSPQWTKVASFLTLAQNEQSFAMQFVPPALLATLQHRNVNRVILAGPNIHKEPEHMARLARELPDLVEVTFHGFILLPTAAEVLSKLLPKLHTIRIGRYNLELFHRFLDMLRVLPGVKHVHLEGCSLSHRAANLRQLLTVRPDLDSLSLINSGFIRAQDIESLRRSFEHTTISVSMPTPLRNSETAQGPPQHPRTTRLQSERRRLWSSSESEDSSSSPGLSTAAVHEPRNRSWRSSRSRGSDHHDRYRW